MARILILEPDEALRALLVHQVSHLRHTPVVAADARFTDAYDAAIVEPADPDSLAVAEALRLCGRATAIVLVSINGATRATAALSPAAHVLKPYLLRDLATALEAALAEAPRPAPCGDLPGRTA